MEWIDFGESLIRIKDISVVTLEPCNDVSVYIKGNSFPFMVHYESGVEAQEDYFRIIEILKNM